MWSKRAVHIQEDGVTTLTEASTTSISGLVELVSQSLTSQTDDCTVLAEIRDELKRHNDLLESQHDRNV